MPLEAELRRYLVELMPLEHAPAHLRLAFHDAGTYDARTRTGGAHGTIHLPDELQRGDNTGWGQQIGLGRTDAANPAPPHRLPGGYEGAGLLKAMFARMGLGARELVALSGAHTLGHTQRRPFTPNPWVFSNAYFVQLLAEPETALLGTDTALLDDPELRPYVELYAADDARFRSDFAAAFRRLTWLGNDADGH